MTDTLTYQHINRLDILFRQHVAGAKMYRTLFKIKWQLGNVPFALLVLRVNVNCWWHISTLSLTLKKVFPFYDYFMKGSILLKSIANDLRRANFRKFGVDKKK